MSMVICQECDHLIDSDEDLDCFCKNVVLCQWCREEHDDEVLAELSEWDMVKS